MTNLIFIYTKHLYNSYERKILGARNFVNGKMFCASRLFSFCFSSFVFLLFIVNYTKIIFPSIHFLWYVKLNEYTYLKTHKHSRILYWPNNVVELVLNKLIYTHIIIVDIALKMIFGDIEHWSQDYQYLSENIK